MNQRGVMASEDPAKLLAVGFGAEGGENLIEQRFSFPRTPILLLNSNSSAADGYLNMHTAAIGADLLIFSHLRRAAARPRTGSQRKDCEWQGSKNLDPTISFEVSEAFDECVSGST